MLHYFIKLWLHIFCAPLFFIEYVSSFFSIIINIQYINVEEILFFLQNKISDAILPGGVEAINY